MKQAGREGETDGDCGWQSERASCEVGAVKLWGGLGGIVNCSVMAQM